MHQRALRLTLIAIVSSIAGLIILGWFDVQGEEREGLENLETDQAIIARSIAALLQERLAAVRKDAVLIAEAHEQRQPASMTTLAAYTDMRLRDAAAPRLVPPAGSSALVLSVAVHGGRVVDLALPLASLTAPLASYEKPPTQTVLLLVPGERTFRGLDGRQFALPKLLDIVRSGAASMRLSRDAAASLGLSPRIAIAGVASVDGGELGRFALVAIVSAERLRDREKRARSRVVILTLAGAGLVSIFGALAFRRQRRELELSREIAVAAVEREHEARLDQAARAATLGTLAMGIAHEISTPASVIQGRAEQLLAKLADDERAQAAVRAIAEQSSRISQVVRGFLDLARGEARAVEVVDVGDLVRGAAALVDHRFAKARVSLDVSLSSSLPQLRGDSRLLEHALVNLLLNACDACPPGGRVQIRAAVEDTFVRLDVLDDGSGISPTHVAHVTQPFFTTKEAGKGSGLGLAITSEIVRAHRGQLKLEARQPRGTCATILLPANQETRL